MIDRVVAQRLAAFAGLTALVDARIFQLVAPQAAASPYIVFTDQAPVDEAPDIDESGNLLSARVQIDAWGETAESARAAMAQVRAALRDFSGTVAGVTVADIRADSGFHDFDGGPGRDVSPRLFRASQDFIIQFYQEG